MLPRLGLPVELVPGAVGESAAGSPSLTIRPVTPGSRGGFAMGWSTGGRGLGGGGAGSGGGIEFVWSDRGIAPLSFLVPSSVCCFASARRHDTQIGQPR